MQKCLTFAFTAILFVGTCETCIADSPGIQLKPDNLKEQPLLFRVTATTTGDRVRFRVTVELKKGNAPTKLHVRLNIYDRKTPLVSCPVAESREKNTVSYEFLVSRKYLAESMLIITDKEYVPKEPEGGAYWFLLSEFASSADASSGEPARQRAPRREVTTNSIGMKLVQVPAGAFDMGASHSDKLAQKDEVPQHRVRITRPFLMGIHEVTVGQFRAFVDSTKYVTAAETKKSSGFNSETRTFQYDQHGFNWKNLGWKQADDHPVLNVNWHDAVAFCEWLSKKEGRKYRLPTEAEWEYACRAGTTSRFINGESIDQLKPLANLQDKSLFAMRPTFSNSEKSTYLSNPVPWDDTYPFSAPAGSFRPNEFGLYDMLGNAAEWCSNWYGDDYYSKSPADDPLGPSESKGRVARGGAFLHQPQHCRVTWRTGAAPTYHNYIIGFRVAADVAFEPKDHKSVKKDAIPLYEGFRADQNLLRKHLIHKGKDGGKDTKGSSGNACESAKRIFSWASFLFRTRTEVLELLGDPATISDYNEPAGKNPTGPLVYVFDTGFGGLKYTISFEQLDRVRVT